MDDSNKAIGNAQINVFGFKPSPPFEEYITRRAQEFCKATTSHQETTLALQLAFWAARLGMMSLRLLNVLSVLNLLNALFEQLQ